MAIKASRCSYADFRGREGRIIPRVVIIIGDSVNLDTLYLGLHFGGGRSFAGEKGAETLRSIRSSALQGPECDVRADLVHLTVRPSIREDCLLITVSAY